MLFFVHPSALLHASLLLIFTPHGLSSLTFGGNGRAKTHVDPFTHEAELAFWAQLIAYTGCPEVLFVDSFEFFATRPTFTRQLFARVAETGQRVAVRRHLGSLQRLPLATHRLAIIVPVVMKPSRVATGELERFFKQITQESNFYEFYCWWFLFTSANEARVSNALRELPIRADSSIYCVIVPDGAVPFRYRAHLERKMMPTERFVRRMQMFPYPEANRRTAIHLMLPWPNTNGSITIRQFYRLQTRSKTIDVSVDLLGTYRSPMGTWDRIRNSL